ncbi:uncharacterized protein FOMMEDRAFT_156246 [Fomitiporia mediterranea MF3/22]|uniref:uncharacterized protein n=1 Tax=Fomitiporia mediterranea (strain MF3/22) TaxID=694068 RepID=UPI00044093EA|nr:uncharacterized protein FOMMEDRAFT_156246 [Fomitiporia mediterranea MF3/22]EJD02883.1 hypothetical protein FOMMEDRAFT_156246 [Fomitiporia mediterranea MF3/22]
MVTFLAFTLLSFLSFCFADSEWIEYPPSGFASMTHYGLPLDAITACGCVPASTHYPTAALGQLAYGSSKAFGPGCGHCFNLTLLNTFLSDPPFFPNVTKSVVVKITDLCPFVSEWCTATNSKPNPAGHQLNFDLAWPSTSIPDDFFPSNASLYGYTDFGVWNISYQSVSCDSWMGASNISAFGVVPDLGPESVCCPTDPFTSPNTTCASYSDLNGLPPEAAPAVSSSTTTRKFIPLDLHTLVIYFAVVILSLCSILL